jgi:hypothetical protein
LAVTGNAGTADTVVVADYDADGFLDLYVTNGFNMRPLGTGGPEKLFRNRGNDNHWIELDLVAKHSMRDALGARVYATSAGVKQVREVNGGYHRWAQDSKRIHFGLAGAKTVDLRVEWPNGDVAVYSDVAADKVYRITQSEGIAAVKLGDGQLIPCGKPAYGPKTDNGLVVWKECVRQVWRVRAVSASGNATYNGVVKSDAALVSVKANSLETGDVLDSDPAADTVAFKFVVPKGSQDGLDLQVEANKTACVAVNSGSEKTTVFYGPLRVRVTPPFDLRTGAPCSTE